MTLIRFLTTTALIKTFKLAVALSCPFEKSAHNALLREIRKVSLVEQEFTVQFQLTENGYVPIMTDNFLEFYYGGAFQLLIELFGRNENNNINNNGNGNNNGNNGNHYGNDNGGGNKPTDPIEPPEDPVVPPTEPIDPPTEPIEPPVILIDDFKYVLNEDGNSSSIVGIGTYTEKDVVIPDTYRG